MTKFGYVRREATNQIDWSAVASQFTTVLKEEAKAREQQKAKLDESTRQMVETLQNSPTGQYVDGNKFIANYAADASQVLLIQDRLLKSGALKPRDYAVVRANLNSSNKQMFKLGQAYQEAYKKKMERMNSADPATRSQKLEPWKMEQAEGLYNLRNTKALINPDSGMVSIGLWKDGKMDTKPGSFATVPELMGNLEGEYDYFDVRKNVQQAVDDLGMIDEIDIQYAAQGGLDKIFKTSSQGGKYSGDDKVLKEYFEWAGYTAESMMANPFHVTSILTNENLRASNGEQYTFTYEPDASKRKPNEIYLDRTNNAGGEPVFTDEQRAQVKDAIIERLNDSVDKKVEVKTSRVPFEPQSVTSKKNKDTKMSLWMNVYAETDPIKRRNLMDAILTDPSTVAAGIVDLNFTNNVAGDSVLEIKYSNPALNKTGENAVVIAGKGKTPTQQEWARAGVPIHGISDPRKIQTAAGGFKTLDENFIFVSPSNISVRRDPVKQELSPQQAVDKAYAEMSQAFRQENISQIKDDDVLAPALAKIGKKFGFIITDNFNEVSILKPGDTTPTRFDQGENEAMMSFMLANIDPSIAKRYFENSQNLSSKTRTIAQIMEEDGVSREEAIIIFNNQKK